MKKNIDYTWINIINNENEIFTTIKGVEYTYTVENGFILINGDKRRRITKDAIEHALKIENPSPSKIKNENIWGPSYVYGIITDERIVKCKQGIFGKNILYNIN